MTGTPPARRALVVGAFGQDNPGDEALLVATVDAVRSVPGWSPVVATARPAQTTVDLDVETVATHPIAVAAAAARTDALVVGGGTLFKELHAASGRRPTALLWSAVALARGVRARGRPVALVGVGAAPLRSRTARRLASELARHADLLVLRDDESAAVLLDAGVPPPLRVGADLSWLIGDPIAASVLTPLDDVVGVALSHLAGGDDLERRLGDALATLDGETVVELEPWQGSPRLGADARVAARLADRVGDRAVVARPPSDLADAVRRAARRRGTVALRFHGAVASALAGRPFLAVAHEPKLVGLARRLGQPSADPMASSSELSRGIDLVRGARPLSQRAVADERERSVATVDLLHLLLAGEGPSTRLARLSLVPEPAPRSA